MDDEHLSIADRRSPIQLAVGNGQSAIWQWRLRAYPIAILAALAMGFVLVLFSGQGAAGLTGRLGGDFPGFYAAGRIVRDGDARHLYSLQRQEAAQRELFPGDKEPGFIVFPYPPCLAAAYAPLAALPYRAAYAIHTLLMAAALGGAILLAGRMLPSIRKYPLASLAAALMFFPMLMAVVGGQNTAIILLLLVATARLLTEAKDEDGRTADGSAHSGSSLILRPSSLFELAAGLCVGLLLYKPQFGLVFLGLFLLTGRWRVVGGAIISGAALYLLGAAVAGIAWPVDWWHAIQEYRHYDHQVNIARSVSWVRLAEGVFGGGAWNAVGWALAAVTAAIVAWFFRFAQDRTWLDRLGLAGVGAVLISPHAMFYDAGLALLPLAVLAGAKTGTDPVSPNGPERPAHIWRLFPISLLALFWLLSYSQIAAEFLHFSPLFPLLLAVFFFSLRNPPALDENVKP